MVTSSMDCTVCIWGVRPIPIQQRYVCLHRFINQSWSFNKDLDIPVSKIALVQDKMAGIRKYRRIKEGLFNASKYGNFNMNFLFSKIE
jgi:hypothetical protein